MPVPAPRIHADTSGLARSPVLGRVRLLLAFSLLVALTLGCGGEEGPNDPPGQTSNIPAALQAVLGDYNITYDAEITKAGQAPRKVKLASPATISVTASQPGVMAVPEGMTIPGLQPEDIIFGAAYVQNPVHVFMGTQTADQHGDFGVWSSVWIGLPPDQVDLEYTVCDQGEDRFSCSPMSWIRST